jgi:Gene product 88
MAAATTVRRRLSRPRLFGSPHVAKLGPLIYPFSIPARRTCPGKSRVCSRSCYATTGFFVMENVRRRHVANLKRTREPGFVADAVAEIKLRCMTVVRLHMAGDFYSAAYARQWATIVRQCPRTTFLCYTRSWTQDAILPVLAELATLKNMHLWFSTDREMPRAPAVAGVRIAYLLDRGEDPARVPADQHLVFRDAEHPPLKRANGVLVCPYEQGIARQVKITCSNCRICWTPERTKSHGQANPQEEGPRPSPRRQARRPARRTRVPHRDR